MEVRVLSAAPYQFPCGASGSTSRSEREDFGSSPDEETILAYRNIEDRRAACKKHYKENKESYLERNRRQKKRTRIAIDEAKNRPCLDCKQMFPPECMDFDHVRGVKKFNIGGAFTSQTLKSIQEEIQKCDVVCANCHRIRTRKRSGNHFE